MADFYNDGSLPYGSVVLTINSVTYVAENITTTIPLGTTIERRDEIGEPSGQVLVKGFETGSATLQLATGSTATPAQFETFTHNSKTYIITEVSEPMQQDGENKVNISFRKKISA